MEEPLKQFTAKENLKYTRRLDNVDWFYCVKTQTYIHLPIYTLSIEIQKLHNQVQSLTKKIELMQQQNESIESDSNYLFKPGEIIYGYCNGFFGRDDYYSKKCVGCNDFQAVFEYLDGPKQGRGVFLDITPNLQKEMVDKWKDIASKPPSE